MLVVTLLVLFLLQHLLFSSPSRREFALHQAKYSLLIQAIKSRGIKYEEFIRLRVDASLDPQSLRSAQQTDSADMVGQITVWRDQDGSYQISIVTRDEGHRGAYGYIYSDLPLHFQGGEGAGQVSSSSNLLFVREQLNSHWWVAYNDLF